MKRKPLFNYAIPIHTCLNEACEGRVYKFRGVFQCIKCGCLSKLMTAKKDFKEGKQPISKDFEEAVKQTLAAQKESEKYIDTLIQKILRGK